MIPMWHADSCAGLSLDERASGAFSMPAAADPVVDFVHDLNNRLFVIRGQATLALMALGDDDGDTAAELRSLLEAVDETTAASRDFRRSLTTPSA